MISSFKSFLAGFRFLNRFWGSKLLNKNLHKVIIYSFVLSFFGGCAGFITPNPSGIRPSAQQKKVDYKENSDTKTIVETSDAKKKEVEKDTKEESIINKDDSWQADLDFGEVFDEEYKKDSEDKKLEGDFKVPVKTVRIELYKNLTKLNTTITKSAAVVYSKQKKEYSLKGNVKILSGGPGGTLRFKTDFDSYLAHFPCTLSTPYDGNIFKLGSNKYAGALIITAGKGNTFNIVNYLSVEEYLRGVVPLELGQRNKSLIEAVKAQAVAARTYTYMKIFERRQHPYDLLPTVADQVYGGVGVAYSVSDLAITETKDQVLLYKKSLINAYYHSTCGGKTANVKDVWNKKGFPYLVSRDDLDSKGIAYCSSSKYFRWKESWGGSALTNILIKNDRSAFPGKPEIKGKFKSMSVKGTYNCGRASVCVIGTSQDIYKYGGDKIRFLLRRNISGFPILRSSSFQVLKSDKNSVVISGRGYGHGVGLCQVGALGRAEAGQKYYEILKAYYTNVKLTTVIKN